MQFFLGNLYSERLSGGPAPATGRATPSVATVVSDVDRLAEPALVASR
jgi:hypothetical protein